MDLGHTVRLEDTVEDMRKVVLADTAVVGEDMVRFAERTAEVVFGRDQQPRHRRPQS